MGFRNVSSSVVLAVKDWRERAEKADCPVESTFGCPLTGIQQGKPAIIQTIV